MCDMELFISKAHSDPRLGPAHISMYLAIWYCWREQGRNGPARVTWRDLAPVAKISGLTLIYKSLRELHEYGYIRYEPSHKSGDKSRVYLLMGNQ